MNTVFRCDNPDCHFSPCLCRCEKAFDAGMFGDDSVETPDGCPFEDSCEIPKWKFVGEKAETTSFGELGRLREWYGEHCEDLPESIRDTIDNLEFYGERARTDWFAVMRFANIMQAAEEDEDRWNLMQKVEEICKKFKKHEIMVSSLYMGFQMGVLKAARIYEEKEEEDEN